MSKFVKYFLASALIAWGGGIAHASDDPAMDRDVLGIALKWEQIKFEEDGSSDQLDHIDALAKEAGRLVAKYPGRVEPLIWLGITTSEEGQVRCYR